MANEFAQIAFDNANQRVALYDRHTAETRNVYAAGFRFRAGARAIACASVPVFSGEP